MKHNKDNHEEDQKEKPGNDAEPKNPALDKAAKPEKQADNPKESREEQLERQFDELTETLQRLQAEFENYKKRIAKENIMMVKCANEDLIKELLPVIDNFELALKSAKHKDEFYKGMELIYSQILGRLENNGLKHIHCRGVKFDPYYHEALLAEETDKEPNAVLDELQKGYMLNEKVLRHSKVKISKKRQGKEKQSPEDDKKKEDIDLQSDKGGD